MHLRLVGNLIRSDGFSVDPLFQFSYARQVFIQLSLIRLPKSFSQKRCVFGNHVQNALAIDITIL